MSKMVNKNREEKESGDEKYRKREKKKKEKYVDTNIYGIKIIK